MHRQTAKNAPAFQDSPIYHARTLIPFNGWKQNVLSWKDTLKKTGLHHC